MWSIIELNYRIHRGICLSTWPSHCINITIEKMTTPSNNVYQTFMQLLHQHNDTIIAKKK